MPFSPGRIGKYRLPERDSRPVSTRRKRFFKASAARILAAVLAVTTVALALPALAGASYGWPIKPFGQEHPVRGQLNDPRTNGPDYYSASSHTFHFGLDIIAPESTAVYAVARGRVHYVSPSAIVVRGTEGAPSFAYWHIRPVVKNGESVRLHALLGYIEPGRDHVHFAENENGRYVNPLRRGALSPYTDTTRPTIASLSYYDGTYHDLTNTTVSGAVRLTVNAFDTPQLVSNWLWAVVTPTRIVWQLFDSNGLKVKAGNLDIGSTLCPLDPLTVFAPGTLKNNSYRAGDYNYWLGQQWDTTRVQNGSYRLVVTVADIRGNTTTKIADFTVANDPVIAPAPSA